MSITASGYKHLSPGEKEAYIARMVSSLWDTSTQETSPDRNRMIENQALFRGEMDWGEFREQNPWRAKIFIHLFSVFVRRMADTIQDLVFQSPDWFKFIPMREEDEEFARIREKIVRYYTECLNVPNFSYEYFLSGGINGLAVWKLAIEQHPIWKPEIILSELESALDSQKKSLSPRKFDAESLAPSMDPSVIEANFMEILDQVLPKSTARKAEVKPKKELQTRLRLYSVNPLNYSFDPDCSAIEDSLYHIESIYKRLPELSPLFESGFFDKAKKKELRKGAERHGGSMAIMTSYEEEKYRIKEQFDSKKTFLPVVHLLEYFGPILSEDGDIIEENRHIVIGNKKVLLRNERNNRWDQKPPYGTTTFSKIPGKVVGAGVADNARTQQLALNESFSLFYDLCNLATFGVSVVDTSKLDDPTQIENGYYPGQVLPGTGRADEIFSKVPFDTNIAPQMFQMFQMLQQTGQQGTSVDVNPSNPSSRARITAEEINANQTRTTQSLFALGREIDTNYIEPLIRAIDATVLQWGFSDQEIQNLYARDILTPDEYALIKDIPPIERIKELTRYVRIEVKGFRERLERDEYLKRMNEAATVLASDPTSGDYIDKKEWWNKYFSLLFPKDMEQKLIIRNSPQDKAREEGHILTNGQSITILPNDDHAAELMVHYQDLLKNPQNPSMTQHVQAHIMALVQMGKVPPTPPPELQEIMFPQTGNSDTLQ